MRATMHPGFCGVDCPDCERADDERDLRDALECDRPRGDQPCGSCYRCRHIPDHREAR